MSALNRPRRTATSTDPSASLKPGGAHWVLRRPRLVAVLLSLVPVAFASIGASFISVRRSPSSRVPRWSSADSLAWRSWAWPVRQ